VLRYEPLPDDQHKFTINFRSARPISRVAFHDRVGSANVLFVHGRSRPIEGLLVRSAQVTVAIHKRETLQLDWRPPDSDRLRSSEIECGDAHVGDGRLPFWIRTHGPASFLALAMDEAFVSEIWQKEFGQARDFELRASIGVRDVVINQIGLLAQKELREGGIGGRLYAESLGAALAVHLLRQYGSAPKAPLIPKGCLSSKPLKRVVDHINEHLQDELSLVELSRIADLSPHRFATAFKTRMGIPPHRYVIERRIDFACELLRRSDKAISEIAYDVGFSSQSHLTTNFRQTTGVTPRKFRESLD
jgi:AraC family transcriptional regulator